jgi:hypoxanthine phosphoribosyltransferase
MNAKNLELKTYISEEKLQAKVKEIGQLLTTKFKGKKVTLT